jgi:hypothetical protein
MVLFKSKNGTVVEMLVPAPGGDSVDLISRFALIPVGKERAVRKEPVTAPVALLMTLSLALSNSPKLGSNFGSKIDIVLESVVLREKLVDRKGKMYPRLPVEPV